LIVNFLYRVFHTMARRYTVWVVYALCGCLVVLAMAWLTSKAFELDRSERLARQQAETQERVGRALWRLDSILTPLLSREMARPQSTFTSWAKPSDEVASAVNSYFEICDAATGVAKVSNKGGSDQQMVPQDRGEHFDFDMLWNKLPDFSADNKANEYQIAAGNNSGEQQISLPNGYANDLLENNSPSQGPGVQVANQSPGQLEEPAPPFPQRTQNEPGRQVDQLADNSSRRGNQQKSMNYRTSDLQNRGNAYQQQMNNTLQNRDSVVAAVTGPPKALWLDNQLVFARRVQRGGEQLVQGCVLNWESLKPILLVEIEDLFPTANLVPIQSLELADEGRMLATIPVTLQVGVIGEPRKDVWPSPIMGAVSVAWVCLAAVAAVSAWMLSAVLALSDRRAAFVSAVTHELRTPLTTFRMYAEMLAGGMVTDPTAQKSYLQTLQTEADRLTHLVENVLLYARLEKAGPEKRQIDTTVEELLRRSTDRLEARVAQSDAKWRLLVPDELLDTVVRTDPGAIEQILFNLVDNACKYGKAADGPSRISLSVTHEGGQVSFAVSDNGAGLCAAAKRRLFVPFSRPAEDAAGGQPGVGLGLALCHRLSKALGATLRHVAGSPGTTFRLELPAR
jgi:signal transduction histidine kinase